MSWQLLASLASKVHQIFDSLNFVETSVHTTKVTPCLQTGFMHVTRDIQLRQVIANTELKPLGQFKQTPRLYSGSSVGNQTHRAC